MAYETLSICTKILGIDQAVAVLQLGAGCMAVQPGSTVLGLERGFAYRTWRQ